MIIAIDMDGVVADYVTAFTRLLIRIHPPLKQEFDIESADFPDRWHWFDMAPKWAVQQASTEVENSGGFWKFLFPYSTGYGDIEFLNKVRGSHDIYFVTTRPGRTAKTESEEWLRMNGFPGATVVICDDKAGFCNACKVDLIVDDRPENLIGYIGTRTKRVLFKRPYNKAHWDKFTTVNTVREALDGV